MSRLLAWTGETPGELERETLRAACGEGARVLGGGSWALIAAGDVQVFSDERSACAVVGTVRTKDAALREASARAGMPAALLAAFRAEGKAFASKLDGPFSILILDDEGGRALALSDKFGIEPLYFMHDGRRAVVADALPALLRHPWSRRDIDLQALYDYLFFSMVPSPATGYRDISRLPPAGAALLRAGKLDISRYWQTRYSNENGNIDYATEAREFLRLLEAAVASEVTAGESMGCFLSGGTDSSTMAGLLTRVTGAPVRTYSIGFNEPGFDEMSFARCAARHFSTIHREYYVTPADIVEMLDRIPAQFGTPFGNSSAVPAYYCARMAREDGITKLLGGDGGDELFGGNEYYRAQVVFSTYDRVPEWLREYLVEPIVGAVSANGRVPIVRKAWRYIEQARMRMPDRLESYNFVHTMGAARMLDPAFLERIETQHPFDLMREEYDGAAASTMLNRIMSMDVKLTLADNDLRKVGEMTRLAGVRVGYPMLHEDLATFAARLPVNEKVRGLTLRYFFKKALSELLPREIIHKRKHGFGLPFGQWMQRDERLRGRVLESLQDFKGRGIARAGFVDELTGRHFLENAGHYGKLIWVFLMLEQWLKQAAGSARVAG